MSGLRPDTRFWNVVKLANASNTQTSTTNTAADVVGSKVVLNAGEAEDGQVYRWTVAGTRSATNAAFTLKLMADTTTLCTFTSDASTAVDWMATVCCMMGAGAAQKIWGNLLMDTEDPDVQYDVGTVNMAAGCTLKLMVTSGNSGDTVTTEVCLLERLY